MEIVTNRNDCRGKLILFLVALAVVAGCHAGLVDNQDIEKHGKADGQKLAEAHDIERPREGAEQGDAETWELIGVRQAADQGDPKAQFYLSGMYSHGWGVPKDEREGVKWCRKAANQGLASAQRHMGTAYRQGWGVPQDIQEAIRWFRKAAEQGNGAAFANLVGLYARNGARYGVPQDYREAAKWLHKAAIAERPKAQFRLADLYASGQGMPPDYVKAFAWYSVVGQLKIRSAPQAIDKRDALRRKMTPDQVRDAQDLAAKLRHEIESRGCC